MLNPSSKPSLLTRVLATTLVASMIVTMPGMTAWATISSSGGSVAQNFVTSSQDPKNSYNSPLQKGDGSGTVSIAAAALQAIQSLQQIEQLITGGHGGLGGVGSLPNLQLPGSVKLDPAKISAAAASGVRNVQTTVSPGTGNNLLSVSATPLAEANLKNIISTLDNGTTPDPIASLTAVPSVPGTSGNLLAPVSQNFVTPEGLLAGVSNQPSGGTNNPSAGQPETNLGNLPVAQTLDQMQSDLNDQKQTKVQFTEQLYVNSRNKQEADKMQINDTAKDISNLQTQIAELLNEKAQAESQVAAGPNAEDGGASYWAAKAKLDEINTKLNATTTARDGTEHAGLQATLSYLQGTVMTAANKSFNTDSTTVRDTLAYLNGLRNSPDYKNLKLSNGKMLTFQTQEALEAKVNKFVDGAQMAVSGGGLFSSMAKYADSYYAGVAVGGGAEAALLIVAGGLAALTPVGWLAIGAAAVAGGTVAALGAAYRSSDTQNAIDAKNAMDASRLRMTNGNKIQALYDQVHQASANLDDAVYSDIKNGNMTQFLQSLTKSTNGLGELSTHLQTVLAELRGVANGTRSANELGGLGKQLLARYGSANVNFAAQSFIESTAAQAQALYNQPLNAFKSSIKQYEGLTQAIQTAQDNLKLETETTVAAALRGNQYAIDTLNTANVPYVDQNGKQFGSLQAWEAATYNTENNIGGPHAYSLGQVSQNLMKGLDSDQRTSIGMVNQIQAIPGDLADNPFHAVAAAGGLALGAAAFTATDGLALYAAGAAGVGILGSGAWDAYTVPANQGPAYWLTTANGLSYTSPTSAGQAFLTGTAGGVSSAVSGLMMSTVLAPPLAGVGEAAAMAGEGAAVGGGSALVTAIRGSEVYQAVSPVLTSVGDAFSSVFNAGVKIPLVDTAVDLGGTALGYLGRGVTSGGVFAGQLAAPLVPVSLAAYGAGTAADGSLSASGVFSALTAPSSAIWDGVATPLIRSAASTLAGGDGMVTATTDWIVAANKITTDVSLFGAAGKLAGAAVGTSAAGELVSQTAMNLPMVNFYQSQIDSLHNAVATGSYGDFVSGVTQMALGVGGAGGGFSESALKEHGYTTEVTPNNGFFGDAQRAASDGFVSSVVSESAKLGVIAAVGQTSPGLAIGSGLVQPVLAGPLAQDRQLAIGTKDAAASVIIDQAAAAAGDDSVPAPAPKSVDAATSYLAGRLKTAPDGSVLLGQTPVDASNPVVKAALDLQKANNQDGPVSLNIGNPAAETVAVPSLEERLPQFQQQLDAAGQDLGKQAIALNSLKTHFDEAQAVSVLNGDKASAQEAQKAGADIATQQAITQANLDRQNAVDTQNKLAENPDSDSVKRQEARVEELRAQQRLLNLGQDIGVNTDTLAKQTNEAQAQLSRLRGDVAEKDAETASSDKNDSGTAKAAQRMADAAYHDAAARLSDAKAGGDPADIKAAEDEVTLAKARQTAANTDAALTAAKIAKAEAAKQAGENQTDPQAAEIAKAKQVYADNQFDLAQARADVAAANQVLADPNASDANKAQAQKTISEAQKTIDSASKRSQVLRSQQDAFNELAQKQKAKTTVDQTRQAVAAIPQADGRYKSAEDAATAEVRLSQARAATEGRQVFNTDQAIETRTKEIEQRRANPEISKFTREVTPGEVNAALDNMTSRLQADVETAGTDAKLAALEVGKFDSDISAGKGFLGGVRDTLSQIRAKLPMLGDSGRSGDEAVIKAAGDTEKAFSARDYADLNSARQDAAKSEAAQQAARDAQVEKVADKLVDKAMKDNPAAMEDARTRAKNLVALYEKLGQWSPSSKEEVPVKNTTSGVSEVEAKQYADQVKQSLLDKMKDKFSDPAAYEKFAKNFNDRWTDGEQGKAIARILEGESIGIQMPVGAGKTIVVQGGVKGRLVATGFTDADIVLKSQPELVKYMTDDLLRVSYQDILNAIAPEGSKPITVYDMTKMAEEVRSGKDPDALRKFQKAMDDTMGVRLWTSESLGHLTTHSLDGKTDAAVGEALRDARNRPTRVVLADEGDILLSDPVQYILSGDSKAIGAEGLEFSKIHDQVVDMVGFKGAVKEGKASADFATSPRPEGSDGIRRADSLDDYKASSEHEQVYYMDGDAKFVSKSAQDFLAKKGMDLGDFERAASALEPSSLRQYMITKDGNGKEVLAPISSSEGRAQADRVLQDRLFAVSTARALGASAEKATEVVRKSSTALSSSGGQMFVGKSQIVLLSGSLEGVRGASAAFGVPVETLGAAKDVYKNVSGDRAQVNIGFPSKDKLARSVSDDIIDNIKKGTDNLETGGSRQLTVSLDSEVRGKIAENIRNEIRNNPEFASKVQDQFDAYMATEKVQKLFAVPDNATPEDLAQIKNLNQYVDDVQKDPANFILLYDESSGDMADAAAKYLSPVTIGSMERAGRGVDYKGNIDITVDATNMRESDLTQALGRVDRFLGQQFTRSIVGLESDINAAVQNAYGSGMSRGLLDAGRAREENESAVSGVTGYGVLKTNKTYADLNTGSAEEVALNKLRLSAWSLEMSASSRGMESNITGLIKDMHLENPIFSAARQYAADSPLHKALQTTIAKMLNNEFYVPQSKAEVGDAISGTERMQRSLDNLKKQALSTLTDLEKNLSSTRGAEAQALKDYVHLLKNDWQGVDISPEAKSKLADVARASTLQDRVGAALKGGEQLAPIIDGKAYSSPTAVLIDQAQSKGGDNVTDTDLQRIQNSARQEVLEGTQAGRVLSGRAVAIANAIDPVTHKPDLTTIKALVMGNTLGPVTPVNVKPNQAIGSFTGVFGQAYTEAREQKASMTRATIDAFKQARAIQSQPALSSLVGIQTSANAFAEAEAVLSRTPANTAQSPNLLALRNAHLQNLVNLAGTPGIDPVQMRQAIDQTKEAIKGKVGAQTFKTIDTTLNRVITVAGTAPQSVVEVGKGYTVARAGKGIRSPVVMMVQDSTPETAVRTAQLLNFAAAANVPVEIRLPAGVTASDNLVKAARKARETANTHGFDTSDLITLTDQGQSPKFAVPSRPLARITAAFSGSQLPTADLPAAAKLLGEIAPLRNQITTLRDELQAAKEAAGANPPSAADQAKQKQLMELAGQVQPLESRLRDLVFDIKQVAPVMANAVDLMGLPVDVQGHLKNLFTEIAAAHDDAAVEAVIQKGVSANLIAVLPTVMPQNRTAYATSVQLKALISPAAMMVVSVLGISQYWLGLAALPVIWPMLKQMTRGGKPSMLMQKPARYGISQPLQMGLVAAVLVGGIVVLHVPLGLALVAVYAKANAAAALANFGFGALRHASQNLAPVALTPVTGASSLNQEHPSVPQAIRGFFGLDRGAPQNSHKAPSRRFASVLASNA